MSEIDELVEKTDLKCMRCGRRNFRVYEERLIALAEAKKNKWKIIPFKDSQDSTYIFECADCGYEETL